MDKGTSTNDSYAARAACGPSQESHPDTESTGAANSVPNEEPNEEFRFSRYGQFRLLSDFEKQHFHPLNVTPDRPCTAFLRVEAETTTKQIFDSLLSDGIPANAVRCLQRKPTGEILITFSKAEYCVQFLDKSALFLRYRGYRRGYPTHPAASMLTFLTIYDAPYQMPDSAIEERLKSYCTVFSRRRGKLQGYPDIANGLRHYRVQLKSNVPCYLRFGKFQLRFSHEGQPKTCRRCGAADHLARDCANEVCFNCDTIGHVAKHCPETMKCCICKSE